MKKAVKYILLGLLLAFGIYVVVSFIVNKDGTMYWINFVWEKLNTPLPIIGITSIALFWFVWNVVVFIRKNQPEKELLALRKSYEEYKQELDKELEQEKEKCEKLQEYLKQLCELSTNQKIKNLGKELDYGRETINSETKAE